MHSLDSTKPDGRSMTLYGSAPIGAGLPAPAPLARPQQANPHLHRQLLRAESITPASHRRNRTFQPEAGAAALQQVAVTLEAP